MRKRYKKPAAAGSRRVSGKVVLISGTVALLAAGTGISLAATQSSSSADSVVCIVTVDAKAAVDANSALSDVFPVGTALHLTSAGRQVDVTVSAPLTAAAPPATTAPTAAPTTAAPSDPASADPSASATADPTATATSAPPAGGASSAPAKPGRKHHRHHKPAATKPAAKPTASAAKAETNAEKAAKVGKVSIKAATNKGVDPNTVCIELSKNAFNTLGNVANGNNVGAFIATITQSAAGTGAGAGNGGASATATAAPTATATASASASAGAGNGTTGGTTHHKKHH